MDELREDFDKMMELYESIKRQIRQRDKHLYERWKAGGFLVDHDIVCMYPDLTEVMEQLDNPEEDEAVEGENPYPSTHAPGPSNDSW